MQVRRSITILSVHALVGIITLLILPIILAGCVSISAPPNIPTAPIVYFPTSNWTLAPSATQFTPPPTYTPRPFETGLFPISNGSGFLWRYPMSHLWRAIIDGQYIEVEIGGRPENPEASPWVIRGAVFVRVTSASLHSRALEQHDAPNDMGLLRVVNVTGARLTLMDPDGKMIAFDVPTRQYLDSPDAMVNAPTVTPLVDTPTPTIVVPYGAPVDVLPTAPPTPYQLPTR